MSQSTFKSRRRAPLHRATLGRNVRCLLPSLKLERRNHLSSRRTSSSRLTVSIVIVCFFSSAHSTHYRVSSCVSAHASSRFCFSLRVSFHATVNDLHSLQHALLHLILPLLPKRLPRARADRLIVVPNTWAPSDDANKRILIVLLKLRLTVMLL